jgi:hypothetical protein
MNSQRRLHELLRTTGLYKVQQFVTPQYAFVEPYSFADTSGYYVPPPIDSMKPHRFAYKQQADEVLQASADLTDEQKLKAELFDNKKPGFLGGIRRPVARPVAAGFHPSGFPYQHGCVRCRHCDLEMEA